MKRNLVKNAAYKNVQHSLSSGEEVLIGDGQASGPNEYDELAAVNNSISSNRLVLPPKFVT